MYAHLGACRREGCERRADTRSLAQLEIGVYSRVLPDLMNSKQLFKPPVEIEPWIRCPLTRAMEATSSWGLCRQVACHWGWGCVHVSQAGILIGSTLSRMLSNERWGLVCDFGGLREAVDDATRSSREF